MVPHARALALACAMTAGCSTAPHQMYAGERRPNAEVAVIGSSGTAHGWRSSTTAEVAKVDGVSPPGLVLVGAAAVLPGTHEVRVRLRFDDHSTVTGPLVFTSADLKFEALPGRRYLAKGYIDDAAGLLVLDTRNAEPLPPQERERLLREGALRFWIEDADSGAEIVRAEWVIDRG